MNTRKGQNTIYMGGDAKNYKQNDNGIITLDSPLREDIEGMKIRKDAEEAQAMFLELEKQKQAELDAKLQTLEMIPTLNRVILLPYPRNPYRKVMAGSIVVEYNGDFLNPDSGEKDTLDELVSCAKVIEVGPETKYLKVGDDVFYDGRAAYPVPFLSLGYLLTAEPQILCVLNEGLKQRFNMS